MTKIVGEGYIVSYISPYRPNQIMYDCPQTSSYYYTYLNARKQADWREKRGFTDVKVLRVSLNIVGEVDESGKSM